MLTGKTIALGVTAGSPVSRLPELIYALNDLHANVEVVMTPNATQLISPLLLGHASRNKVSVEAFTPPDVWEKEHKPLGKSDLFVIAPATANTIGKAAFGIADNLLTTTILSCDCPILFVPNMAPTMFRNPRVQRNIETLKADGCLFFSHPDTKPGKMPPTKYLIDAILEIFK